MIRWLFVAMLVLGVVAPTTAQDLSDDNSNNLQIYRGVSAAVQRYAFFTIFDAVHASIDEGVVTLTGKVTMPYKASDIAERVSRLEGVRAVRNRLEVLPVSQFDNELRFRLARAIYSHPVLSMYGLGANPSIHIIVERGRVTLDGVVNNDMDRQVARAVAGSFMSFGITNALKTDKEVQDELERL